MSKIKIVSYLRVSTSRQGISGLGIEAQRAAVAAYAAEHGGELVQEFVEIESGRKANRPQLMAAIERVQLTGARLVIAKLDRLSRNAFFLFKLAHEGIDFVAADAPHANRLTVGIMALVAEEEARAISARTKAALAAAKARGVQLGNPRGFGDRQPGHEHGMAARIAKADLFASRVGPMIQNMRRQGETLDAIAKKLAQAGAETARGGAWTPAAVRNVLLRVEG